MARSFCRLAWFAMLLFWQIRPAPGVAADTGDSDYLKFVRAEAAALRAYDENPKTRDEWRRRKRELREDLERSWGDFPTRPSPLDPRKLGELQRDGYRVERVTFQTLPGIWMLANVYVPDRPGKLPAVLCVHGHWPRAKQDPVVQTRCIGLAKLGFVVLAVDAFGAGERAIGTALGEYHGSMTGAMLFPIGRPLSGIQVYENQRCVDYLLSRTEVDPRRIGVTGASGGGNQSMYAGAYDERFAATVPVCSVGNYQAYLGAACCMCEVVPGALRYAEEGDLLALTAPRALMVISATRDAPQFSVPEAKTSLARTTKIFRLVEQPDHVRHTLIESAHDYNQPMREAMYGWMTKFLKGEGDGQPIPEPEIKPEDPEVLRCYPGDSRPENYVTIPRFAAAEAAKLLAARRPATSVTSRETATRQLAVSLAANLATAAPLELKVDTADDVRELSFQSEPRIRLTARQTPAEAKPRKVAIVLDWAGGAAAAASEPAKSLRAAGWTLVTVDLRATGALAVRGDTIGEAPDHNSAEWGLWIGRPLMGQWVHDVRRTVDALQAADDQLPERITLVGIGPAGLVALCSAALDERIHHTVCVGTLGSYVSDVPYRKQLLGVMVPGLLRDVGDVKHLAALVARPVTMVAPVHGSGAVMTAEEIAKQFRGVPNVRTIAAGEEADLGAIGGE